MYHTKVELAAYLNVSVSSIDRHRKTGIIPYYRLGGQIRFLFAEVDAALAKNCRVVGRQRLAH
jgi:excisionase family DNA binding protein